MSKNVMKNAWVWPLLAIASCGGDGGETGTGPLAGTKGTPKDCTGVLDPVQALSEACCQKYGVDACGAGLFCAAFDGRKFDTCYPLRSRLALEECTDDSHCATGACEPTTKLCKGSYGDDCTTATGCFDGDECRNACP